MALDFSDFLPTFCYTIIILLVLLAAIYFTSVIFSQHNTFKYPPGPRGLPLIGFFPSLLGDTPNIVLDGLAKKYGDVFSIKIAGTPYIVLSSYEAIKAAYVDDAANFCDRPMGFSVLGQLFNFKALAFQNGTEWKAHRKILSKWLKAGSSQTDLHTQIFETAQRLVTSIHALNSKPFDIYELLAYSTIDVMSSLVCAEPLAADRPDKAASLLKGMRTLFGMAPGWEGLVSGRIINLIHNPFTKKRKEIKKIQELQFDLMRGFIQEHQSTIDPKKPRDYIDSFLIELGASGEKDSSWFNLEKLAANMAMIYAGGTDTTSSALYFGVFLMAKHPEIESRCQDELDSNLESEVLGLRDRKKLPYIEAVVNEIIRYAAVAGLPQPRSNHKKTKIFSFDIPAKTNFITNLWTATRDPKYFSNPNVFDPDNYYGNVLSRELISLPFSAGKRNCPGEAVARLEIFVILTSILKEFTLSFPLGSTGDMADEKLLNGFNRALAPFTIIANPR